MIITLICDQRNKQYMTKNKLYRTGHEIQMKINDASGTRSPMTTSKKRVQDNFISILN